MLASETVFVLKWASVFMSTPLQAVGAAAV
jgi:hypothetical protein